MFSHKVCVAPMMQYTDMHDRFLLRLISKNIYSKQGLQYSINKNLDSSPSNGKWESITQSEKFKIFSNTSISLKNILKSTYTPTVSFGFEYEKINFTQLIEDDTYGDGNQMQKTNSKPEHLNEIL